MSDSPEKFSDDPEEHFKMENEFLKIKIAAQFGGGFGMTGGDLPPEIENQFLKQILAFEDFAANTPVDTKLIKTILGNPSFPSSSNMSEDELERQLATAHQLYEEHDIRVNFMATYTNKLMYDFMTIELMYHEVDVSFNMPGMISNYMYEEFHPNHAYDIEEQGRQFLDGWLQQDTNIVGMLLVDKIAIAPQHILTKKEVLTSIGYLFQAFESFENCVYVITEVSYDLQEDTGLGFSYIAGAIKYDGIMENGEMVHFEGPMKIYLTLEHAYWSVMFYEIPGFKW